MTGPGKTFCVLLSTILLWTGAGYSVQKLDGIVAIIGDSVILSSELDAYTMLKLNQAGTQADSAEMAALRPQALDELLDGKVLLVHAEKDTNISISDYEVETELSSRISMILRQNNIAIEDFETVLKKQEGMTLTKFKMEIRKQIRNELIKQKVQQRYVNMDAPNKRDVSVFYKQFKDSLPVNGKSVLLSTIMLQVQPSAQLRQDAFTKISAIKQRLDKGENFIELATQFSQDPNAASGGDLGFIAKGTLSEIAFEERAFALKTGETSAPFETRLGFHIITVEGQKDRMVHVRQIFIPVKPPESEITRCVSLLDSIRAAARTPADFIAAVKRFSQDDVTKSRDGRLKWQTVSSLEPAVARAIDSLSAGGITKPIRRDNTVTIYRVDERLDTRPLTLENDWNEIADIAQRMSTQKKLFDIVKKWRQETYIDIRK
jgi:peptidyl-prolyl cis-trans isomerase SurA